MEEENVTFTEEETQRIILARQFGWTNIYLTSERELRGCPPSPKFHYAPLPTLEELSQ